MYECINRECSWKGKATPDFFCPKCGCTIVEVSPKPSWKSQTLGRQAIIQHTAGRKRLIKIGGLPAPGWLIAEHEEAHMRLGHPERPGGEIETTPEGKTAPHIIREEEEAWKAVAAKLRSEGRWTSQAKQVVINALASYYNLHGQPDYDRASRFVNNL